jgi:hypothetical protein
MSKWASWLESWLVHAAPNRSFDAADAQRRAHELARACGAIECGSGDVFGVRFDPAVHAEMVPLLSRLRSMLAEWGAVLEQCFGDAGRDAFDQLCTSAGVVIAGSEAVRTISYAGSGDAAELEAVRSAPGNRDAVAVLADALARRGDPIGSYLRDALELELLPRGSPRFFELQRSVARVQACERDRLAALVWPTELEALSKNAYFRHGLPTSVLLDGETLGRFAPALWSTAPIADAQIGLLGNERLDEAFATHPAFARATSLAITFRAFCKTDLGPLFALHGPAIEQVHAVWSPKRAAELARLRHPEALRRLSISGSHGTKASKLTAAEIDQLVISGVTGVRELSVTCVRVDTDAIKALARTGWTLETVELHEALAAKSARALLASPLLSTAHTLVIRGTALDATELRALAKSEYLRRLVCLDLRQSIEGGLEALLRNLALPNLRSLILAGRPLQPPDIAAIASSSRLRDLTELDLSGGNIGDHGVRVLATATELDGLRALSLCGNAITVEGARGLLQAPWLGQLEALNLRSNRLGDDKLALRAELEGLPRMRHLEI